MEANTSARFMACITITFSTPVQHACGQIGCWRVNAGGRRLNHAIHMVALTRLQSDQKGFRVFF